MMALAMNPGNEQKREVSIAGQPLGYYLAGSSEQADVAAHRLAAHFRSLRALLGRLEELVVPDRLAVVARLIDLATNHGAHVSLIGQVKAGKTRLTNALTGMPGMLPSDVNPWTSVVTTVHINTPKPSGSDAVFTFYTEQDWANLTQSGGHLGKLAERASFETELDEMREQIRAMQTQTEARLGANFGLLLGSQHQFRGFTPSLLEKYVCMGDPDDPRKATGRYADVTKAANLYIDSPDQILPNRISDTPGVNDPFLARERATLATLGKTDICIIVLSANQALSTVDLALMRVLMSMKADQLILFVNRIDELDAPDTQIPEIDAFIREVLRSKGIRSRVPIVYGSAAWAEMALTGDSAGLSRGSLGRLMLLAEQRSERARKSPKGERMHLGLPPYSIDKTRDLSGLGELKSLITHKSVHNVGAPLAAEILLRARNAAIQSTLILSRMLEEDLQLKQGLDLAAMVARMQRVLQGLDLNFPQLVATITERMLMKISTAFREFISRETVSLREAANSGKRVTNWTPETEILRVELNNAYHDFAAEMATDISRFYEQTAESLRAIYSDIIEGPSQLFSVKAPPVPEQRTPAILMRSMSFDLKSNWIDSWLSRTRGAESLSKRMTDLVTAEMMQFLEELRKEHISAYSENVLQVLREFVQDHLETLQKIATTDGKSAVNEARQKLGVELELRERLVALKGLVTELEAQTDTIVADFRLRLE